MGADYAGDGDNSLFLGASGCCDHAKAFRVGATCDDLPRGCIGLRCGHGLAVPGAFDSRYDHLPAVSLHALGTYAERAGEIYRQAIPNRT